MLEQIRQLICGDQQATHCVVQHIHGEGGGWGVDLFGECIARYKVPYEVTVVVPLCVLAHHGVWHY